MVMIVCILQHHKALHFQTSCWHGSITENIKWRVAINNDVFFLEMYFLVIFTSTSKRYLNRVLKIYFIHFLNVPMDQTRWTSRGLVHNNEPALALPVCS